jgi:hypothetical protein
MAYGAAAPVIAVPVLDSEPGGRAEAVLHPAG